MVIDFHTHCFPEHLAERAVGRLSRVGGGLMPYTDGTLDGLRQRMAQDGVDVSVVLNIATNAKQQTNVNNFAAAINNGTDIISFGSVFPGAEDAFEELERIKELGLKGVKFHPEYQHFYVNDEKMRPIYRKISELGLITTFHAGKDFAFKEPYHGLPEHMLGALKWLDAPVVAAHWGGEGCGIEVLDKLCGENLWFDLSFGYGAMPKPVAQAIIDRHDPDKLLFGSDIPWHRPEWELRLLNSLDISEELREKIFFRNAMKLLEL